MTEYPHNEYLERIADDGLTGFGIFAVEIVGLTDISMALRKIRLRSFFCDIPPMLG